MNRASTPAIGIPPIISTAVAKPWCPTADKRSLREGCLRGYFGSLVTDNSNIGKGASNLSITYRYQLIQQHFIETQQYLSTTCLSIAGIEKLSQDYSMI